MTDLALENTFAHNTAKHMYCETHLINNTSSHRYAAVKRIFCTDELRDNLRLSIDDREYCAEYVTAHVSDTYNSELVALQSFNPQERAHEESKSFFKSRCSMQRRLDNLSVISDANFVYEAERLLYFLDKTQEQFSSTEQALHRLCESYCSIATRIRQARHAHHAIVAGNKRLHNMISLCMTQAYIQENKLCAIIDPIKYDRLGIGAYIKQYSIFN